MNYLVIGVSSFIGRHVIEHVLAAGHQVAMFNRGLTNPDVFSKVERIVGEP